jgi:hypothetical protein
LTTNVKWKEGNAFRPDMNWEDVLGNLKESIEQVRREVTRSGAAKSKAYKVESLEKMLKKAKDE